VVGPVIINAYDYNDWQLRLTVVEVLSQVALSVPYSQ
jgi:hypothetical protein